MKERPINLKAWEVRAIREGRKTQFRRIFKFRETNQPPSCPDKFNPRAVTQPCPYGAPGDRLWVREAWATSAALDDRRPADAEKPGRGYGWPVWYAAGGGEVTWRGATEGGPSFTTRGKGRPSIHMPRWASRFDLELVSRRVERLVEISEEDAVAEGIDPDWVNTAAGRDGLVPVYARLWQSINGPGSWAENPWVWVVEFRLV